MKNSVAFDKISVAVMDGKEKKFILSEFDLTVPYGRITALAGPSGSGKTTALRVAACALKPSSGRMTVLGWDGRLVNGRRVAAVRRRIGIVPQSAVLPLYHGSVAAMLTHIMHLTGRGGGSAEARICEAMELTGTGHLRSRNPAALSTGEARRVSIARALISRPDLLLLDEPTANLDDDNAESIRSILAGVKDAGLAVLAATHDPALLAISSSVHSLVGPSKERKK